MRTDHNRRTPPLSHVAATLTGSLFMGAAGAQTVQQVKDIETSQTGPVGSSLRTFIAGTSKVWFSAADHNNSQELWVTDGTEAGTAIVRDIAPNSYSIDPYGDLSSEPFAVEVNGVLLFRARTASLGYELWKSDGTGDGTRLVKDIVPGESGSYPKRFVSMNGRAYFVAYQSGTGEELWTSDGTSAGTTIVKDINPVATDSGPLNLTVVGNLLYFVAGDGVNGYELWRSDGSEAGTFMVVDINPGAAGSLGASAIYPIAGQLYFAANDGVHGTELWRCDGTAAGTQMIADIYPGDGHAWPQEITGLGDAVLFTADDGGVQGRELWRADSTGTAMVIDLTAPGSTSAGSNPRKLTVVEARVFFGANDTDGYGLFTTDGTAGGTVKVGPVAPDPDFGPPIAFGGRLFYCANAWGFGLELWVSDGSAEGTYMFKDIYGGPTGSAAGGFFAFGDELLFSADHPTYGGELWITDGTGAGTVLVKDIARTNGSSSPQQMAGAGGMLYFSIGDSLYKSDGTGPGTVLVKTLTPPSDQALVNEPRDFGGVLFFTATSIDGINNGRQLWRSDGTGAGTVPVLSPPPPGGNSPAGLTEYNGRLYYAYITYPEGRELWSSDGTHAGTYRVKDIRPDSTNSAGISHLTVAGTRLFFEADDGTNGMELWVTDGTEAGTSMVKDIRAGSASGLPAGFSSRFYADLAGTLVFAGGTSATGIELWKSDGTEAGTELVADCLPGTAGSFPSLITVVNGAAYFRANAGALGQQLWRSDGTAAGTYMVKDFNPQEGGSPKIDVMTTDGGLLYFTVYAGNGPVQLWASDGSNAGTQMLREIWPDSISRPGLYRLTAAGPVYFVGYDASTGIELFRTDGTPANTLPVEVVAGPGGSLVDKHAMAGDKFYFTASDGVTGVELWSVPVGEIVFPPRCGADYNHDGFVDGIDSDQFNNDFESTDPQQQIRADYNHDGFVDGIDYDQFNNAFEAGC